MTRWRTCWKVDDVPISGTNYFGIFSRDTGSGRAPAAPHNITGNNLTVMPPSRQARR